MQISFPALASAGNRVRYQARIHTSGAPELLWFDVDEAGADLLTTSSDPALVAMLIPAMARGEDIQVEGHVSTQLYHNLSGPYQALLRCVMPWLRRIRIQAEHVAPAARTGQAVVTGFSGGIDSFCVLADFCSEQTPPELKVTHLIYNNVGSHSEGGEELFRERFARLAPAATSLGLPFVAINSNLQAFFSDPRLGFQQTHTVRNAAAALLLQAGSSRYLYASSYAYADIFVGPTAAIARTDPVSLPMLSTESMQLISSGSEYTRVEKTLRVAEVPASHESLDVCVWAQHAGNCSKCWKCMRTLLTLEIAGYLPRYARVFDLRAYRQRRSRFIGEVLQSSSPLMKEIVTFARQRGYPLPLRSRLYSLMPLDLARRLKKALSRRVASVLARGAMAAPARHMAIS